MSKNAGSNGESVISDALTMKQNLGKNVSHARHNFRLSVLNGTLAGISKEFLHTELVLAEVPPIFLFIEKSLSALKSTIGVYQSILSVFKHLI